MTKPSRPFSVGLVGLDFPGIPLEAAFEAAAEWGAEHLDLYSRENYTRDEVDEIPALSRRYGVSVRTVGSRAMPCGIGNNVDGELDLMREALEDAARVGAEFSETMVGAGDQSEEAAIERYAQLVGPLVDRARELGVVIVIENVFHRAGGTDPTSSVTGLQALVEKINDPHAGICWDTANFVVDGGDSYPVPYETLKPWIRTVHLKDARVRDVDADPRIEDTRVMGEPRRKTFAAVPLGSGVVRVDEIVTRLIADGFGGPVSVELFCEPQRRDWYWCESRPWLEARNLLGASEAVPL